MLLRFVNECMDCIEIRWPVHECLAVDTEQGAVDTVAGLLGWWTDGGAPNVVDHALADILEAISVSQYLNGGSSTEGVAEDGYAVAVDSVFPLCPVNTVKTSGTGADVSLAPEVLVGDFPASAAVDVTHDAVRLFNLCEPQLKLRVSQLRVDSFVIARNGVVGVVCESRQQEKVRSSTVHYPWERCSPGLRVR